LTNASNITNIHISNLSSYGVLMAKTKSIGIRVTPELNEEIERLKEAFGFTSFGEMLESFVRILQLVDQDIYRIESHPRDWSKEDVQNYLSGGNSDWIDPRTSELGKLLWRRLRERFGQDGVERARELLEKRSREMKAELR